MQFPPQRMIKEVKEFYKQYVLETPEEPWITFMKLKCHWKMTQPWNWHGNMADFTRICQFLTRHLPAPQTPSSGTSRSRPFIFLRESVNTKTMFMQQKGRVATIDFIAVAISGKLFERYDYDEYQK